MEGEVVHYGRGEHPNARATQFKPGESGNPAGHPKNEPLITPRLRRFLQMTPPELDEMFALKRAGQLIMADVLALSILERATKSEWGDKMREIVIDRVDGVQKATVGEEGVHGARVIIREVTHREIEVELSDT